MFHDVYTQRCLCFTMSTLKAVYVPGAYIPSCLCLLVCTFHLLYFRVSTFHHAYITRSLHSMLSMFPGAYIPSCLCLLVCTFHLLYFRVSTFHHAYITRSLHSMMSMFLVLTVHRVCVSWCVHSMYYISECQHSIMPILPGAYIP